MRLTCKKYLILSLSIAFLFGFSVFFHECVHYTADYFMGATEIRLSYDRVYAKPLYTKEAQEIRKKNWDEKRNKLRENFPEKTHYLFLKEQIISHIIISSASAPVTIFFISTVVWWVVFFNRRLIQMDSLLGKILFPMATIMGAEVLQMVIYTVSYFIGSQKRYGIDLAKTASWLGLPNGLLVYTTGILASLMLGFLVFKIIPRTERLPIIISGLAGAFLGYVLWFHLLGPWLLPDIPLAKE